MRSNRVIILIITLLIFWRSATSAQAEPLAFGGPELPARLNILSSEHALAKVARDSMLSALTTSNVSEKAALPYGLELADSLKADKNGERWSFRLKRGSRFSNGAEITLHDVIWSLTRCRERGVLPMVSSIEMSEPGTRPSDELWVEISLRHGALKEVNSFPLTLSECPIFEEASASVFSSALGESTNIVTAGPFKISEYRPGRGMLLTRAQASREGTRSLREVELKGFADSEVGLAALRRGHIALLFTEESAVIARAKDDETLKTGSCAGYSWIARRGLETDCSRGLSLDTVRYE